MEPEHNCSSLLLEAAVLRAAVAAAVAAAWAWLLLLRLLLHTAHNKERSTVTDNYLVKELDACMEEKRRRKYHIDYRPANENSQFAAPAWQRMRAILVSSVWNFCTVLRSTNSCGSVLYTSTIPNMERIYNVS